ncbi:NUDIX hydrolase [Horticoccus luteus]|uniref:GDP-mannose pyrophosphatase n=1 Tax=Horticoccus luteus TaxID=2862869 RepID=A0A8F9XHN1_9BACT|nr:NUDIX hydrolase [Horticoccus luteus]QYM79510.1 NUDIX hydrolase [Horticoccus luteus]
MATNEPTDPAKIARWEKLGHALLASTRVFELRSTRYRHPVRLTERDFIVAHPPDWVNVLALTPDHHLVLVRQFRFGTEAFSWEIPGGVMHVGEDPLVGGPRELREETGFIGAPARLLGSVHPNPAIQSNRCHFVLVEQAAQTAALEWDADEEIEVTTLPVEEVLARVHAGEITHGLVLNALLFFQKYWETMRPR